MPEITGILLAFAAGLLPVLALIPWARKAALRAGFVDQPGGRKDHDEAVPPIGGLVVFPVFIAVNTLAGAPAAKFWPLYAGMAALLALGALDDRFHLNAWVKFFMQFAVAALVVLVGSARLYHLGNLFGFGDFGLGFMSVPFSIVAVVLLINAVNLMDGLDGLAGGKGFVALLWLILACAIAGNAQEMQPVLPLAGALAGFLFYNLRHPLREKASVFLGDAGSLALGLALAWFCIDLAQQPGQVLEPMSVAWILALPIFDSCGQFYRRVREGRHPFSPDRGHFHHHFIHAGIPVRRTTAMILLLSFAFGGIGYFGVLAGLPLYILTWVWIALLLVHIALSGKPHIYIGFLERFAGRC